MSKQSTGCALPARNHIESLSDRRISDDCR
jgi:hypothetical protein